MKARMLVALLGSLAALGWAPVASSEQAQPEPFLQVSQDVYRGRVVELLTERPLERAIVLMMWESDPRDDGTPIAFALREVLTDAAGHFAMDASAIEASRPPRALEPRILIYKPGYAIFPPGSGSRFGAPLNRLMSAGAVVQIRPLAKVEERIEAFNAFLAAFQQVTGPLPGLSIPESTRVIAEELENLGRAMQELQKPGARQ